jgi:predicted ester cyclase
VVKGQHAISNEENAVIMRRWFTEGWLVNLDLADSFFCPTFSTNGIAVGLDSPKRNIINRITSFPDVRTDVEDLLAFEDKAIMRVRWRCTHTGVYSGVPPTGKPVEVRAISIWRFANGQVVENWTIQDQFSLLQQVGVISPEVGGAQVPAVSIKAQ